MFEFKQQSEWMNKTPSGMTVWGPKDAPLKWACPACGWWHEWAFERCCKCGKAKAVDAPTA